MCPAALPRFSTRSVIAKPVRTLAVAIRVPSPRRTNCQLCIKNPQRYVPAPFLLPKESPVSAQIFVDSRKKNLYNL